MQSFKLLPKLVSLGSKSVYCKGTVHYFFLLDVNNKFFLFLENGLVDVLSNSEVRSFYVIKLLYVQQSAVILVIFYHKELKSRQPSRSRIKEKEVVIHMDALFLQ